MFIMTDANPADNPEGLEKVKKSVDIENLMQDFIISYNIKKSTQFLSALFYYC
jgi:hypothetical protein